MPSLVRANIFQRKTRAAITMIAVAIEVMAVLLIVGLTNGTLNEVSGRMQAVGADIMVLPEGSSPILGLSSTTMTDHMMQIVSDFEGVAAVAPVLAWTTQAPEISGGSPVNMWAIDENFQKVGASLEMLEGRGLSFAPGAYEMVVDRRLASANNLHVGQSVTVLNSEWRIVGIAQAGIGARIFVPLAQLQLLTGQENRLHLLFVKAEDLTSTGDLATRLENAIPNIQTNLLEEYSAALAENIVGLNQFNAAISGIAVALSFLVILLAMYTSIIERTREIGILKALGGSKTYIVLTIMQESMILSALGVVGGYGLGRLVASMLTSMYPTLTVQFSWDWTVYASALGILGGIMGSFYPAIRAARQDPVRALRDE